MQVDIPLFTIDDDIPASGLEIQAYPNAQQQPSENPSVLSVDDILGSVSFPIHCYAHANTLLCSVLIKIKERLKSLFSKALLNRF